MDQRGITRINPSDLVENSPSDSRLTQSDHRLRTRSSAVASNHCSLLAPPTGSIVDNVEDINYLTGLIPSGDGMRVVATTTKQGGLGRPGWNSIKVGVRSQHVDRSLTVTNSDDREARIWPDFRRLPVAVAQAAATARNKDLSLARYLQRLVPRRELVIRPIPGR